MSCPTHEWLIIVNSISFSLLFLSWYHYLYYICMIYNVLLVDIFILCTTDHSFLPWQLEILSQTNINKRKYCITTPHKCISNFQVNYKEFCISNQIKYRLEEPTVLGLGSPSPDLNIIFPLWGTEVIGMLLKIEVRLG